MMVINLSKANCRLLFATLFILCLLSSVCFSQYKALKVGDRVPDILIKDVTNYDNRQSLRLEEFRGKYVVLDFWSHDCISCLQSFPSVDRVQKEFADDLQIIAVNTRSSLETTHLFKRLKNLHLPNIPFINADTALKQLFPYRGVPHHVWLDREGRFMQAADMFNLNRDSLSQLLRTGKLDLMAKVKPILVENMLDERFLSDLGFASYIYRQGERKFLLSPKNNGKGLSMTSAVANLYSYAFDDLTLGKYGLMRPGRVVLEVEHPERFQFPKGMKGRDLKEWMAKYVYVYQSVLPENTKVNPQKMMLEDLERYFNFYGTVEKRSIKCMVLVRTSKTDKLASGGGTPENTLTAVTAKSAMPATTIRKLQNTDYSMLSGKIKGLVEYTLKLPFVDSTSYNGKVDFIFDGRDLDNLTLEKLKIGLRKYDLDLEEREVLMDVLVLREKNSGSVNAEKM